MADKYHIGKDGKPSVCKAQNQCPLAPRGEHYSKEEAELVYQVRNEMEHGLLAGSEKEKFKIASTDKEKQYIEIRLKSIAQRENENSKIKPSREQITSVKMLESYTPSGNETYHFTEERKERMDIIDGDIGRGNCIASLEVEKEIAPSVKKKFVYRMHDSGYVEIYSHSTKENVHEQVLITAYVFSRKNYEHVFLSSGKIANEEILDTVSKNHGILNKKEKEVKKIKQENKALKAELAKKEAELKQAKRKLAEAEKIIKKAEEEKKRGSIEKEKRRRQEERLIGRRGRQEGQSEKQEPQKHKSSEVKENQTKNKDPYAKISSIENECAELRASIAHREKSLSPKLQKEFSQLKNSLREKNSHLSKMNFGETRALNISDELKDFILKDKAERRKIKRLKDKIKKARKFTQSDVDKAKNL